MQELDGLLLMIVRGIVLNNQDHISIRGDGVIVGNSLPPKHLFDFYDWHFEMFFDELKWNNFIHINLLLISLFIEWEQFEHCLKIMSTP